MHVRVKPLLNDHLSMTTSLQRPPVGKDQLMMLTTTALTLVLRQQGTMQKLMLLHYKYACILSI